MEIDDELKDFGWKGWRKGLCDGGRKVCGKSHEHASLREVKEEKFP